MNLGWALRDTTLTVFPPRRTAARQSRLREIVAMEPAG